MSAYNMKDLQQYTKKSVQDIVLDNIIAKKECYH